MKLDLKALYEKHTKDGVVDYVKAQEEFQKQWNGYDAKQKTKIQEQVETAKKEGVSTFITGLGIENVKDGEAFVKFTDNLTKSASEKDTELAKFSDYDSVKEKLATAEGTIFSHTVKGEIADKFNKDYVDDMFELIKGNEDISDSTKRAALIKTKVEDKKYNSWLKEAKPKAQFRKQSDVKENGDKKVRNPSKKYW